MKGKLYIQNNYMCVCDCLFYTEDHII